MRISDWSSDVCSSDLKSSGECLTVGGRGPCPNNGDPSAVPVRELTATEQERRPIWDHPQVAGVPLVVSGQQRPVRSEEHTSELQSLMRISSAVFCLKKNTNKTITKPLLQQQHI